MTILTARQFKKNFSSVLKRVQAGEVIAIAHGKDKEIVAKLVPNTPGKKTKRKPGIYDGKSIIKFNKDFKITEEGFPG